MAPGLRVASNDEDGARSHVLFFADDATNARALIEAYLKDVIERMAGGHPMARLDDLLPWNWKAAAASA